MQDIMVWDASWAWSLPLIALNVTFHVIGLGFIHGRGVQVLGTMRNHRHFLYVFALVMGAMTMLVTVLHAIEAGFWAAAYKGLGALPDAKSAILYSLSAITTFGHADLYLATRWQPMGAMEALNGMILFGLTTAFLYGMIQRVWLAEAQEIHRPVMPRSRRKPALDAIAPGIERGAVEVASASRSR
jgi:hypothetical protein